MSFAEDDAAVFSAEELLTVDEAQLVRYMERNACAEGGFDISGASGLERLSRHQLDKLTARLKQGDACRFFIPCPVANPSFLGRAAARRVESADESSSVDIGTLLERLASVAGGLDTPRKRPRTWSQSSTCTSPPDGEDIESICYKELIQNGGRPVVSFELLSQASRGAKKSCEKGLPWLDDADSGNRDGGMPMVFSRQLDRWWEFLKWQIDNRGTVVGDVGVSAFLEAQKRRYTLSGSHAMVSDSTFEETIRRQWDMRPKLLEVPSHAGFPAYKEAVKRRLASHHFTRAFQLEDDPRQQGVWTTWVEYLNFEYWQADRLAASSKALEPRYRKAWRGLQRADTWQPCAPYSSKASSADAPCLRQQLGTAQAELEALRQKMDDFIREAGPYRRAEEAARRQNMLTHWVLQQVDVIEAECTQERTGVGSGQGKAMAGKKRRRAEDNGAPAEGGSKRLRGDGSGGTVELQPTSLGRRTSKRLHSARH